MSPESDDGSADPLLSDLRRAIAQEKRSSPAVGARGFCWGAGVLCALSLQSLDSYPRATRRPSRRVRARSSRTVGPTELVPSALNCWCSTNCTPCAQPEKSHSTQASTRRKITWPIVPGKPAGLLYVVIDCHRVALELTVGLGSAGGRLVRVNASRPPPARLSWAVLRCVVGSPAASRWRSPLSARMLHRCTTKACCRVPVPPVGP